MCRKGPTFSHRPSDVYLIRLGMEWSHVFPLLSAFEGPHKASLDHQPALGKTCSEVARGWLPLVPFQAASTPSQLMMQNEKLFRFWLRRRHQYGLYKVFYALGVEWTGSVKQAIYQLITSERLDEHMPPLSQDIEGQLMRKTLRETTRGLLLSRAWCSCSLMWKLNTGRALLSSLFFSFCRHHRYVRPTCQRPISCVINEVVLSVSPNALCFFFFWTFFPSTGCLEEKIDKFHFSFMLLCPGLYSGRWKQQHQVCWSRDGTQPSGSIVD